MKAINRINIDQLHIKVPGLSKHQGRILGEKIAQGLVKQWPVNSGPVDIAAVKLRLQHNVDTGTTQRLANQIVKAIIQVVNK